MAGADRMQVEEVVRKVLVDEHADVLRESVKWLARQLMEVEVSELIGAEHGERTEDRSHSPKSPARTRQLHPDPLTARSGLVWPNGVHGATSGLALSSRHGGRGPTGCACLCPRLVVVGRSGSPVPLLLPRMREAYDHEAVADLRAAGCTHARGRKCEIRHAARTPGRLRYAASFARLTPPSSRLAQARPSASGPSISRQGFTPSLSQAILTRAEMLPM